MTAQQKAPSRTAFCRLFCRKMSRGVPNFPCPRRDPVPMGTDSSDQSCSKGAFTILFRLDFPTYRAMWYNQLVIHFWILVWGKQTRTCVLYALSCFALFIWKALCQNVLCRWEFLAHSLKGHGGPRHPHTSCQHPSHQASPATRREQAGKGSNIFFYWCK